MTTSANFWALRPKSTYDAHVQPLWPGGPVLPVGLLVFILGATIGSFLNVVIARLPEGLSVVRPGSRCPHCKAPVRAWQNIPIVSWLLLRGRCAQCKTAISLRYPMVELLTASLFIAVYSRFGWSWGLLLGMVLSGSLVAITFVDIDIWEIPDEISLPGIVIGALLRPLAFDVPWYSGLVGAALGASFLWLVRWGYFVVRKTEGMGLGDVKLIAMIGAFLGVGALIPTILVASVAGTLIGAVVHFAARRAPTEPPLAEESNSHPAPVEPPTNEQPSGEQPTIEEDDEENWTPPAGAVPFGPFLALGALSQLLFAPAFTRLYAIWWGL